MVTHDADVKENITAVSVRIWTLALRMICVRMEVTARMYLALHSPVAALVVGMVFCAVMWTGACQAHVKRTKHVCLAWECMLVAVFQRDTMGLSALITTHARTDHVLTEGGVYPMETWSKNQFNSFKIGNSKLNYGVHNSRLIVVSACDNSQCTKSNLKWVL